MPGNIQISVVIPTRNRDASLARCLGLLAGQLTAADEVIVTDDGRSAATREMVASRFPFARWIPGAQRGPAANRNGGASQATGEFLLFIDDDVEPTPELLPGYRESIRAGVNVYEGRTTCVAGLHSPLEAAPVNETGGWLWSCNMMVRRTLWQSIGGFDEDFRYPHFEDVVFKEQILAAGEQILFVPRACVDHPPRRVPPPRVLALHSEAYFIHHYKYLGRAPSMAKYWVEFVRERFHTVLSYPFTSDTLVALGAICVEASHVLARWHTWNRRWSTRMRAQG